MKIILSFFHSHYDAQVGGMTAAGFSLLSGIQDRLINVCWSLVSGISVFLVIYAVKKIFKIKD